MQLQCGECGGEIDTETLIDMGNMCGTCARPCRDCGRLHWEENGNTVSHRDGRRTYLKNGKIHLEGPKSTSPPKEICVIYLE